MLPLVVFGSRITTAGFPLAFSQAFPLAFVVVGVFAACNFDGQPVTGGIDSGTPDASEGPCGNGILNTNEECDDGNTESSDGCTSTCLVEPGFECREIGENCVRVTGISWMTAQPAIAAIGSSSGGSDICTSMACECASNEVLVGMRGGFRDSTINSDGVAQLQSICAALEFEPTGSAATEAGIFGEIIGTGSIDGGITTVMCPSGSVVSRLRGLNMSSGGFVRALELDCTPLAHNDGSLSPGPETPVAGRVGESGQLTENSPCLPGQLAIGLQGSSGAVVDTVTLRCAVISTTP